MVHIKKKKNHLEKSQKIQKVSDITKGKFEKGQNTDIYNLDI